MNRRRFIAGTGLVLSVPVAGCIDGSGDPDGGAGDEGGDGDDENDGNGGDDTDVVPEDPRTDSPPHNPEEPEYPDDPADEDEWDDLYLCAGMETEPSQSFEPVRARPRIREFDIDSPNPSYAIRLLTSQEELESAIAVENATDRDRLEAVDFDEEAIVVVESGFGSGSVAHHWQRVEADGDVLHLHGCYTQPLVRTDDYTARHSVLVIERPDSLRFARVSLTTDTDTQVYFNSTEDVVTPEA